MLHHHVQLRTEVNKVLETARTGKLIGSSLDAKIYLYVADAGFNSRLHRMSEALNEADTLHRIFITSQVFLIFLQMPRLNEALFHLYFTYLWIV